MHVTTSQDGNLLLNFLSLQPIIMKTPPNYLKRLMLHVYMFCYLDY